MNLYLVTFQMSGEERENLMVARIKEQSSWARITSHSWCIRTEVAKATEIRDQLGNSVSIQSEERLMVVNITKSAWGSYNLPKEVADWLKE